MRFIHNDPLLKERRRSLRNNSTPEEVILWNYLRASRMGKPFRRQFGIGPYIVDFYCVELRLVIELDGSFHQFQQGYDQERDNFLVSLECVVIRFPNKLIRDNLQGALEIVQEKISDLDSY
jgi:very-short-patch-repair endonuclease